MKKIAIMVFSTGIGGAESVVKQIFTRANREGLDFVLITSEEIKDEFENPAYKVRSVGKLGCKNFIDRISRKISYVLLVQIFKRADILIKLQMIPVIKNIEKIIEEEKINVIHAHLCRDIYCLSKIKIKSNIKKIMTIHDANGLDGMGFDQFPLKDVKKMYESADCVTSACQYFFDLFEKNNINLKNKNLIFNGIDVEKISNILPEKYDNKRFNIVFLGGDRVIKGCDYLEKAIDICVNRYGKKEILVHVLREVSESSEFYKNIVSNYLKDYFNIIGYVKNNKHLDYMKGSDLYVLPSRTEGVANTLLEAVGLNLCILATNVGGTGEIIQHGVNGQLVEPNAESVAEGILYLLQNEKTRDRYKATNTENSKKYEWKNIVEYYFDLYEKI